MVNEQGRTNNEQVKTRIQVCVTLKPQLYPIVITILGQERTLMVFSRKLDFDPEKCKTMRGPQNSLRG